METDEQASSQSDRRAAGSICKPHPPGTGTLASDAGGGGVFFLACSGAGGCCCCAGAVQFSTLNTAAAELPFAVPDRGCWLPLYESSIMSPLEIVNPIVAGAGGTVVISMTGFLLAFWSSW